MARPPPPLQTGIPLQGSHGRVGIIFKPLFRNLYALASVDMNL